MYFLTQILLMCLSVSYFAIGGPEEEHGVKYASKCEVCKVVATELEAKLDETGKTHDVLEIGYSVDDVSPKRKKEYKKSELRLVESMEDVCERILEYNIHKERTDSTRFAKGMSQTFKTLHTLVQKGVTVDLGMPYELWDKPSVEITTLKSQCEDLLENHESDIEDWYHNHQGKIPLIRYLCSERALKGGDDSCLKEKGETGSDAKEKKKRKKKKQSDDVERKNFEDSYIIREFNGVLLKGKRAQDGQFPWLIQFQTIAPCGGVLLSPDWVLTAAQCVQDKRNSIMLFATGLNGTGSKQTVPVKATYIYPTYEAYSVLPDRDHNVALLKLTKPFDMCPNKVTLPDVLPVNYNDDDYKLCLIFGWQSYVSLSSKVLAKPIHYDVVILNSWRMCTYMIKTTTNYTNLFCAMVEFKDEMKACAGNPGSPVVCENQNRETALVGIASWTNFSFECGDLPTYIDLGSFRIWMSELVFNIKNAEEWERNKELDGKRCPNDTNIRQNRSDLLRLDSRVNFKRKNTRVQFPNSSRTLVKHPESENINDSYLLNKFHRSANSFNNISTPPDGYYEMYVDVSKEASSNIFKYREIGSSQNNNQVVENVKNEQFTVMNRSSLCDQQFDKVTVKQSTEQTEIDDFELLLPFTFEDVGVSRSNIITVYFKGLYLFIYFVSCYFYIIYMQ